MSALAESGPIPSLSPTRAALDKPMDLRFLLVFLAVIAGGLFFMAYSIYSDMPPRAATPTDACCRSFCSASRC